MTEQSLTEARFRELSKAVESSGAAYKVIEREHGLILRSFQADPNDVQLVIRFQNATNALEHAKQTVVLSRAILHHLRMEIFSPEPEGIKP